MESAKWPYGRLSAGVEANFEKLESCSMAGIVAEKGEGSSRARVAVDSSSDEYFDAEEGDMSDESEDGLHCSRYVARYNRDSPRPMSIADEEDATRTSTLLSLPTEIIDYILSFLPPNDLDIASNVCHKMRVHAHNDLLWYSHIQEHVPGLVVSSPAPCSTYYDLWHIHDPHWFIPKHKIWFSDVAFTGKLIIARYDPRRGCIEAYRLVAERTRPEFEPWEHDDQVLLHYFKPTVKLHLDVPVLQLDVRRSTEAEEREVDPPIRGERRMELCEESGRYTSFSNLFLTRDVEAYPGMQVWPPEIFPSNHRVRNHSQSQFRDRGYMPGRKSEISQHAFRIHRKLMSNLMALAAPIMGNGRSRLTPTQEVQTFATLDPKLYTPTPQYPWRGIWIGDYSGHGCEFMLMHQPELPPFDQSSVVRKENETDAEFEQRRHDAAIYRGSIQAIKITGDPNIPRAENTFVAEDISDDALVRIAEEKTFHGARIVKSRGHVAERFFLRDKYIESQLILISPDRLAQYWLGFGHISFYERVDIDKFTNPVSGW